jgi:hypothetical protein
MQYALHDSGTYYLAHLLPVSRVRDGGRNQDAVTSTSDFERHLELDTLAIIAQCGTRNHHKERTEYLQFHRWNHIPTMFQTVVVNTSGFGRRLEFGTLILIAKGRIHNPPSIVFQSSTFFSVLCIY